jgi:hypothetical protein
MNHCKLSTSSDAGEDIWLEPSNKLLSELVMKLVLAVILVSCSQIANSCEFLYGTWKSSMKESYDYASQNPGVQRKQLDFVKYAFGHMMLTFSERSVEVHDTGDIEVIIEGKNYPFSFEGEKSSINYKTCTNELIEVEYEYFGVKDTYQYIVVNENLYWVKLESAIGREYFRRVK